MLDLRRQLLALARELALRVGQLMLQLRQLAPQLEILARERRRRRRRFHATGWQRRRRRSRRHEHPIHAKPIRGVLGVLIPLALVTPRSFHHCVERRYPTSRDAPLTVSESAGRNRAPWGY